MVSGIRCRAQVYDPERFCLCYFETSRGPAASSRSPAVSLYFPQPTQWLTQKLDGWAIGTLIAILQVDVTGIQGLRGPMARSWLAVSQIG